MFWVLFFTVASITEASNILWLSGLASPSHQLWSAVLQKALAERGHNVTALSVNVDIVHVKNLTFVHLENVYAHYASGVIDYDALADSGPLKTVYNLAKFRSEACVPIFRSSGLRTLMAYPEDFKFDLVVHDFVAAQCLLGLVPRFGNPPLMSVSASTCLISTSFASGNPQYPNFVPANQLNKGFNMAAWERGLNYLLYTIDNLFTGYVSLRRQNAMAKEYFGMEDLDVSEISKSSALTLVNLPPYDVMQPFYQTVIPVGGLHIKQPKQLENDLLDFIEKSQDGVVYFALGTNLQIEKFSEREIYAFLGAFKQFPAYRFLWKFDPKFMVKELPNNIMIKKWLPQNDILAHPKVKVFIGHGGALSCQEAVWYAVPQLIMPFMIDQKQNAARAVERGYALQLDHANLSTELVKTALYELLSSPSYKTEILKYSRAFRDQPQTPLERAIFWIEYTLRNGKNMKLRSPGQDSLAFENLLLYAVVTLVVILFARIKI